MCYDWAKKKCHYGILGYDHDRQRCNTSSMWERSDCVAEGSHGSGEQLSGAKFVGYPPRIEVAGSTMTRNPGEEG
jgi:hypothetical protein